MISQVSGKLVKVKDTLAYIESNGICYEVIVPTTVAKALAPKKGTDLTLLTYYYFQESKRRYVPTLIGFNNELEKEFFLELLKVPNVGPTLALNLLSKPFHTIAEAITTSNTAELTSIKGIAKKTAEEIVLHLKNKAPKYALIRDDIIPQMPVTPDDLREEAMEVLLSLGHKRIEAKEMIARALQSQPQPKNTEELLQAVYRARSS